jgi:hypothetical protein
VEEIAPGIWHWAAPHPRIKSVVHSYYLPAERVLIDPIAPEDGLEWFAEHGPPTDVLMTNRHHYRSSASFVERYGVTVHCVRQGMHEHAGRAIEPFDFGDEVCNGIVAHEVGAICPDETALWISDAAALVIADGIVRRDGEMRFVSDGLLGDDPESVKAGLRRAYSRLLDRDFDNLLFAHGDPLIGGGKEALRRFAEPG